MTGADTFRLDVYLAGERERVDQALLRAMDRYGALLSPCLAPVAGDSLLSGGKRLRPILCVAAFHACRQAARRPAPPPADLPAGIYEVAASIEMIHAYSLMHDDLPCMDDAPLRRGAPTAHTVHGEVATMRAGLALIPLAALHCWEAAGRLGLGRRRRRRLVSTLMRAAGARGMVGGQAADLLAEGRELSKGELDTLHRMKTGALLRASVCVGAVAASAGPDAVAALDAYGRAIGLAFQIADDVLDATADTERIGKEPSDAALGKSTYVRFLGVEAAREEAKRVAAAGRGALRGAGIDSAELEALARYAASRDR